MQAKTKYAIALLVLTLFVLLFRLLISFEVAQPGYQSYFALMQAHEIRTTGTPRFLDPYSFQGRHFVFNPFYYYLVAFCTLFLPEVFVVKLLPNLAMALLVPLIYLLGHTLTRSRWASLIAAFFAGFAPILFETHLNVASPMSLALPVLAFAFLTLFRVEERPNSVFIAIVLLALLSPVVWLLVVTLIVYFLLLVVERLKPSVALLETGLFALLFTTWYTLITYKPALHTYGFAILSGALPASVRAATFQRFTLLAMLYGVGIVPIALGSLALYNATFEMRSRKHLLLASGLFTTLIAALLHLITLVDALLLLSLLFLMLSASGLHLIARYFRKTRFTLLSHVIIGAFFLFFILTSMLPALAGGVYPQSSPTQEEIAAVDWLGQQPPSVIANAPQSGFLINKEAKHQYVADEAYLLSPDPEEILHSLDTLYTAPSTVSAVEQAEKLGVTRILLGPAEYARYPFLGAVIKDRDCFPLLHQEGTVFVMGVNCTIEARS